MKRRGKGESFFNKNDYIIITCIVSSQAKSKKIWVGSNWVARSGFHLAKTSLVIDVMMLQDAYWKQKLNADASRNIQYSGNRADILRSFEVRE